MNRHGLRYAKSAPAKRQQIFIWTGTDYATLNPRQQSGHRHGLRYAKSATIKWTQALITLC